MKKSKDIDEMIQQLFAGNRRAASRLITRVENETEDHHEIMKKISLSG